LRLLTYKREKQKEKHRMSNQNSNRKRPQTWGEIAELYQVTPRCVFEWRKKSGFDDMKGRRLRPADVARIFDAWGDPYDDDPRKNGGNKFGGRNS
jgi:hypothetical protein